MPKVEGKASGTGVDQAGEPQVVVDAEGMSYRELNLRLRELVSQGASHIRVQHVCGQRYIGTGLPGQVTIEVEGVPGSDLGAFMDGPRIMVRGNVQDGCGNTMSGGEIIVHGHAGDVVALSARGGKVFIRDGIGYRGAIHMKEYADKRPVLVVGQSAQDFLGEYMAGGIVILLGLNLAAGEGHRCRFLGSGMHGGVIYIRGPVEELSWGKEVGIVPLDDTDFTVIGTLVGEFATHFGYEAGAILQGQFTKLLPCSVRPYGRIYAY